MALKRRPPTAINPLDDFRDALKRQRPCTHHGEIALCKSREEARLWWETIDACSPPKRLEHLRWFGLNDLFFLLVYLLNRKHLDTDFHFARCVEVGANPYNHMDLWFREAGKSEVVSFGQNIRDVLNDPDVTIGIFSHSRPMAKSFLRLIKVEFEGNELLKEVFPDILFKDPQKDSPKWSEDDGITVRRRFGNRKESTIEAWGLIDGQPTSRRFTILHYDDVISRKEINTPEMVDRTTREFENSLALTASDPPKYRYLATYQEINDTTHQLVNRKFGPVRCYPAVDDNGMPVLFSEEKLAWFRERTSPKMFALQYLLDPVRASSDAQIGFSMDWLTYRKPSEMPEVQTLNIYMVVDPAGNGPHAVSKFALWVMGIDARGNWFALDAVHDRINLAQRADIVIEKLAKWKPLKLGYETYGMQSDVEYLRERFREEGIICNLVPLGGTRSNQDDRIEALIPDFRMGKFILPAGGIYHVNSEGRRVNVIEEFVQHEYCLWPYGRQKDLFDAMSRVKDAKLNVTQPRAYGDSAFKVNDPWGSAASQTGSWMSE